MRSWVTDSNKNNRPVSLDYRFNVSMQESLSIGANLNEYTELEIEKCKKYNFCDGKENFTKSGDFFMKQGKQILLENPLESSMWILKD